MLSRVPAVARILIAALAAAGAIALCAACSSNDAQPEPAAAPAPAAEQRQALPEPARQPESKEDDPAQAEQAGQAEPAEREEAAEPGGAVEQQAEEAEQEPEQEEDERPQTVFTYLPTDAVRTAEGIPIIRDNRSPVNYGYNDYWRTLWGIRILDFDELGAGCPYRDCIPSIENPRFETIDEAAAVLVDAMPLVHVEVDGDARGYPLDILTRREIVNDVIGGEPIAVTFCPLCNTAIGFKRTIGGEVLEFGVSGLLRNSDLVMYDRATQTLWQQATGRAIIGAYVGARLEKVSAVIVSFGQFREEFPDGLVLSRDGGTYGRNPYVNYDSDETPFLFRGEIDPRLSGIERVVGIETTSPADGSPEYIAYPWSAVSERRVINDVRGGAPIAVFWAPGANTALGAANIAEAADIGAAAVFDARIGDIALFFEPNPDDPQTFLDNATGSTWNIFGRAVAGQFEGVQLAPVIHADYFWFAWAAFHPDTEVFGQG